MKITKIDSYLVSTDVNFNNWATLHDSGSYIRIEKDYWYYMDKNLNITNRVSEFRTNELEKEFQETINVIHEQIPLI
jgi:hypothetical protein